MSNGKKNTILIDVKLNNSNNNNKNKNDRIDSTVTGKSYYGGSGR